MSLLLAWDFLIFAHSMFWPSFALFIFRFQTISAFLRDLVSVSYSALFFLALLPSSLGLLISSVVEEGGLCKLIVSEIFPLPGEKLYTFFFPGSRFLFEPFLSFFKSFSSPEQNL